MILLAFPAAAFILLQNKKIQTYLTSEITSQVADNLHADFRIGSVDMILFNRVVLRDVLLKDQHMDTLVYAPRMVATLKKLNYKKRILEVNRLKLNESTIRFAIDTTNTLNLEFIIEGIRNLADTAEKPWSFMVNNIALNGSAFLFEDNREPELQEQHAGPGTGVLPGNNPRPGELDFSDIKLTSLDADLRNLEKQGDTVRFFLKKLRCTDHNGFHVDDFNCQASFSPRFMHFRDAYIDGPSTLIEAGRINFDFDDYSDFVPGEFGHRVEMDLLIQEARISFRDLGAFVPEMLDWPEHFDFSGRIHGKIDNLKGRQLAVNYNAHAAFLGDVDMIGLPRFEETFMFFDIRGLNLDLRKLDGFQVPGKSGNRISISETMGQLGNISYKGKLTGFPDDFVSYGRFETDLGRIASDISIKPDSANSIRFNGRLETRGFDLGRLLDAHEQVGKMSMNGNVNGTVTRAGDVYASMNGGISSLHFHDYDYHGISLAGQLSKNKFDGSFSVSDPNLSMEFFGLIDFSGTVPEFNFTTNIDRANLYPLNISRSDPDYTVSCEVQANFTGTRLDDYDGNITLLNSSYRKAGKVVRIRDMVLEARHSGDTNKLLLRSNLVDAEMIGSYNFVDIAGSAASIIRHHFPKYSANWELPEPPSDPVGNRFSYRIHFKNTRPFTDFFLPDLEIARNSTIRGEYRPAEYRFDLSGYFPSLRYKDNSMDELLVDLSSNDSLMVLNSECSTFKRGSLLNVRGVLVDAVAGRDSMEFAFNWLDEGLQVNTGHISGFTRYIAENESGKQGLLINLNPGDITINDTTWTVDPASARIDTSFIELNNIAFHHNQQQLVINGIVSERPGDKLSVTFNRFDLRHVNQLSRQSTIRFDGVLEGTGTISDVYDNPLFLSDLVVDELKINDEELGRTSLAANWVNSARKVHIDLKSMRGNLETIQVTGDYLPGDRKLDFRIGLDKLRMNILRPYLDEWISNVSGIASGHLTLTGTIGQPVFNGELELQKSSFKVDYLQTSYSFSNKLAIRDNRINFSDFGIRDEKGSLALLNGSIDNHYLRDFVFDLQLETTDFYFLNTRERDNNTYYGSAVASGLINLKGPAGDLRLNISARTGKDTRLFIPLHGEGEVTENNFITYVGDRSQDAGSAGGDKYEVRLSGVNMVFDLEVTPDAEVQIIFDPQVGDILKGNGSGALTFEINDRGDFEMYGDYTFESGEYLFTLQNIINKRLKLQQGSIITWNGDPLNAVIDLDAVYSAKASPIVLVPDGPEYLKNRLPVDCHLIMTGSLLTPSISYKIELPTAEEETRNYVRNAINSEEELTKQFLSLLVINKFSSSHLATAATISGGSAGASKVTASELLSNQLSNWFSQISSDFDLGVNYRPGDEISTDQVELALSTQILDERVSIHTNLDVSGSSEQGTSTGTNTTYIAGEFDVDVKLTDDGKLKVKAFNHSNDDLLYKTSPYTQGVGFVYGEDFNNIRELLRRYFGKRKNQETDQADKN